MYYPYFRGKQYELKLVREQASFLAKTNIHPIIEPVSENLSPLRRTIQEFIKYGADFTIIMNPKHGYFKNSNGALLGLLSDKSLGGYEGIYFGYIIKPDTDLNVLRRIITRHSEVNFSLIHYGFTDTKRLLSIINEASNIKQHVFIENHSSQLYRSRFSKRGILRILVRDGFNIMRNADYPNDEHFSDLHLTYAKNNMDGFGDFLIVGDHYTASGGRPYAVTIHITYLDEDDDMNIRHFISNRTQSRADTPGKFLEALNKLSAELNNRNTNIYQSNACAEYMGLCERGHFPQLGYVKKLSMQHHLELMASFLSRH